MINNSEALKRLDTLYRSLDYKLCLAAWAADGTEMRGGQSRLAEAAGCQRSYLSQVIKGIQHLTLEHGMQLAKHFCFDDNSTDYWLDLISLGRAGSVQLRERLQARLQKKRMEWNDLQSHVLGKSLSPEQQSVYYSAWYWSAVHVALSIPRLQSVDDLAKALGLPQETLHQVLIGLQDMGLACPSGTNQWVSTGEHLHLSRRSPYNAMNHLNWRQRAMVASFCEDEALRFSSCISLSYSDFRLLKDRLKTFLSETARVVDESKPECLVAFNIDLLSLEESSGPKIHP